jgi:hypothetical protein
MDKKLISSYTLPRFLMHNTSYIEDVRLTLICFSGTICFFLQVLLRCTQISEYYFLFVGFTNEFSSKTVSKKNHGKQASTMIFLVSELENL